jgi:hypothetical protein
MYSQLDSFSYDWKIYSHGSPRCQMLSVLQLCRLFPNLLGFLVFEAHDISKLCSREISCSRRSVFVFLVAVVVALVAHQ